NSDQYDKLKPYAMKLGSAFQKINFVRDLHTDYKDLGRTYFPGVDMNDFNDDIKREIEAEMDADFKIGYEGIKQLPQDSRFGVFVSYVYYYQLFRKIKRHHTCDILSRRVRINDRIKFALFLKSYVRHRFNLL